jgi:hypothetical protein
LHARSFLFENAQDSGIARAKLHKKNECNALSKFCSNGDRFWPDTPSFEYFGSSEVTPATCDFSLSKCHEDAGEYVEARLHYEQALVLGWEPPQPRCIWGHRHGFAENGTAVEANGPASWNGRCHSRWDTCDPMNAAILNFSDAARAYNSPLFPVGSVCTAVCLGTVDDAETFSLRSDFTCGADGVWKGELLCPDTLAAANAGQSGYGVGETSPRSTWRADNLSALQPRWQLSAVPLRTAASAVPKVECEWVDTRAIRGTHVWVHFAPPDSNYKSDGDELDMNFDIEHAPVVKVYSTIYTDMGSIVEYKEV